MNPGTILICVPNDNWNDFGNQTSFEFSLVTMPRVVIWKKFKLAFHKSTRNEESEYDVVKEIFNQKASSILSVDNFPGFFSMQHSTASYKDLVAELGEQNAKSVLVVLGDIVIAEKEELPPVWLDSALKSEAFNLSFLRSPDGFLAYFEGYNAFKGRELEFDISPPQTLKLAFQLDAFANPHQFEFNFSVESTLPRNMAVIVGKNGVGKSRTLNELAHAVLGNKNNLTDGAGLSPIITKLIAVCTPGETEATFPPAGGNKSETRYIRLSAIPGARPGGSNESLPLTLQKLARQDIAENSYRWQIFKHAIETLIPFEQLTIVPLTSTTDRQQYSDEAYSYSTVRLIDLNKGAEKIRLDAARRLDRNGTLARTVNEKHYPLSSGQLSFVRLAAQLCLHIGSGALVLIDEPETHLHPHMITQFVVMLNKILEITNSIAIIATHSAYLVREIPTTQVHVITQGNEDSISIGFPRIKTFGSDVGTISSFIFEDDSINKLIEDVALEIKNDKYLSENWEKALSDELSTEAIMYLKRAQKKIDGGGK